MTRSVICLIFGLLCTAVTSIAHASFIGQSFDAHYGYPDVDTVYPFGTPNPASFTVVDPGAETVFDKVGPGAIGFTSAAIDASTTMAGFDTSDVLLQS